MTLAAQATSTAHAALSSLPLSSLLEPASIAIIGASRDTSRIGGVALDHLRRLGYRGAVYPVNPRYAEIGELPCYPDIESVPRTPDVAVLALGAEDVLPQLRRCHAVGIRAAILYASGFAEAGEAGVARQAELSAFARDSGMAIAGPNCMGLANLTTRAVTAFATTFRAFPPQDGPGRVSLLTQSGNVCAIVYATGRQMDVGFHQFINTGNEACLDYADYLDYLAGDAQTGIVVGYVEGLRDGPRFIDAAARLRAAGKPLILLKAGESEAGSSATQSHTAVLAGNQAIYRAAFAQLGAMQARDPAHLTDLAYLAGFHQRSAGGRVVVASVSGAMGALSADLLSAAGLAVPPLDPALQQRLQAAVPEIGGVANPVDMTGNLFNREGLAYAVLDHLAADPGTDVIFLYATAYLLDRVAGELIDVAGKTSRLIVVATTGEPASRERLAAAGIALFPDVARAAQALGTYVGWLGTAAPTARWMALRAQSAAGGAGDVPDASLDEYQAKQWLAGFGVPIGAEAVAATPDDAAMAAERIGYPVAVKVLSPDIAHKTEVGGVRLGLADAQQVRAAAAEIVASASRAMPQARQRGLLVQQMTNGVCELIVGVTRDPVFGPAMTVGLGGIFTEIFHDVTHRLLPVDREMAREMLSGLRGYRLMTGFRGKPAADIDAAAAAIAALSDAALALGDQLGEMEVNPLMVRAAGQGAVALDALIVMNGQASGGERHGWEH
ncbi:acetate--CoA ligase family protein [Cupriavidus alkaliphilus]|uniref:Acyl-CoA synthetase (NDP forming) n=1 Tax=Cupriavidus alkaliphilus TaxID=942866 RepID=A0A7W4YRK3_9BURK|nr:acetate--CoA ligase family protein [Cupriavidus alkaliphilus]MBB3008713.1 acyl-CoA synthetase (NDP forming) [Cupriavidus alkaliphilus]